MKRYRLEEGSFDPLGATPDGGGVNFALYSEHASAVELCVFEEGAEHRMFLPSQTHHIFHGYLPGARPGLAYGYRVHGPHRPTEGMRFNPNKLLLDPYALDWEGRFVLSDDDFGYPIGHPDQDLVLDPRDNAAHAPRGRVVELNRDWCWGDDRHPRTAWSDTMIYEMHVKGMTQLHPLVPPELRGTFRGLASPPVIEHLQRLGVTAVELLPVQSILSDRRLRELGLKNYWGYGTINFFSAARRYGTLRDFREMVKAFHRAGLEVILDVVYNHTGEGSHLGPTLSFRGIDNATYYRLDPQNPRYYRDYTGCGNTVNTDHPQVLQLVMDSLRFWVQEMHVDGFRYDLATALARHRSSFLDAVHQDPALRHTKMIAEPWDLGEGGYQVGNFPPRWAEWNDRYRDCLRRYWRGDPGQVADLAMRLTGSSDLYGRRGKGPLRSINFVSCHDGFTLRDLVCYEQKHNLANGEGNRDGSNSNWSRNFGAEGPSSDPSIEARRLRQQKSMLTTLYLSLGVPMLWNGDEFGRTQQGNNNAYCQDNDISWVDWSLLENPCELLEHCRQLSQLRQSFAMFGSHYHLQPEEHALWLHPEGRTVQPTDWHDGNLRTLGMLLRGPKQELLLLTHAAEEPCEFRLARPWRSHWKIVLRSFPEPKPPLGPWHLLPGGALVALRSRPPRPTTGRKRRTSGKNT